MIKRLRVVTNAYFLKNDFTYLILSNYEYVRIVLKEKLFLCSINCSNLHVKKEAGVLYSEAITHRV